MNSIQTVTERTPGKRMFRAFMRYTEHNKCPITDYIKFPGSEELIAGRWVIGNTLRYPKSSHYIKQCWLQECGAKEGWYPILMETIGESTGVKDDDIGFDIFEWDIVEFTDRGKNIRGLVTYSDGYYCAEWKDPDSGLTKSYSLDGIKKKGSIEIIGNFFSTPEEL